MGRALQSKQVSVGAGSWTAITAMSNCESLIIRNPSDTDCLIRTDESDATTEETLSAGTEIQLTQPRIEGEQFPYTAGQQVCVAKSTSGTITLIRRLTTPG